MSQWITIAELRARRRRYMLPYTYAACQMIASMPYEESAAVVVPVERDRPKRRYHSIKEILMLQPRGPRLLVKRIDAPKTTSSTIIIPETVDGEKSCYAIVLAIGNKVTEDVQIADTVILAQYCGSPVQVELDGEMLEAQIVMETDVLAVVEE